MNRKTAILALALIAMLNAWGWCADAPKQPRALPNAPGGEPYVPAETDSTTILSFDDGISYYYFNLPDEFGDHYFNVRFTAPDSCRLLGGIFFFYKVSTDTTPVPDVHVLVWDNNGSYPDSALDSTLVPSGDIQLQPDSTYVPLEGLTLPDFAANAKFHLGWENPHATDTLAILADDGIPETSTSLEWWEGHGWGTMEDDWGIGVNFMIRALVEIIGPDTSTGVEVWLKPDHPNAFELTGPFPNPFNPETHLLIHLAKPAQIELNAYDLSGRLVQEIALGSYPPGQHLVRWDAAALPAGTYLLRLRSGERVSSLKATLVK